MKIKKKTSLMMVAASTAAIVGIAAVSFAAWQGGSATLTASAQTGHVDLVGFTTTAADIGTLDDLYPVDQGSDVTTSVSFEANYVITEDSTITVTATTTLTGLYVKVSDTEVTSMPTTETAVTAENSGWTKLGGNAKIEHSVTVAANNAEQTLYVYVVLVSSNVAEMNVGYTISLAFPTT